MESKIKKKKSTRSIGAHEIAQNRIFTKNTGAQETVYKQFMGQDCKLTAQQSITEWLRGPTRRLTAQESRKKEFRGPTV